MVKTRPGRSEMLGLCDYHGNDRSCPRPWLVFDPNDGKLTIADDVDDPTARDFGLSKADALKLARALQHYAKHGVPSAAISIGQGDVEQALGGG
jgi:hypothetical protein